MYEKFVFVTICLWAFHSNVHDGNILQLFPKSEMTTFQPLRVMTFQFLSRKMTVPHACSTIPVVRDWREYLLGSPKSGMTTFNSNKKAVSGLRMAATLPSANDCSVIQLWLTPYLLRESTETTHQADCVSRTGVLQREYRGLKPRDSTQHYAPERVTAFQMEGHQLTTCSQI